jgi:helicase MOV-10
MILLVTYTNYCCWRPVLCFCLQLHLLLHLEELQQETDVRAYDIEGATLSTGGNGKLLGLLVPGLAEARPSVMRGDALYVSEQGSSSQEYQGFVWQVQKEQVWMDSIRLTSVC